MSNPFGAKGESRPAPGTPVIQVQVADRTPQQYPIDPHPYPVNHRTSPTFRHSGGSTYYGSLFDVGIFKDTLAPSLALHTSLSVAAWGVGAYTNRLETKDWLWPSAQVINAWWSAVGRRVVRGGLPLSVALNSLSWPERLLLTGVTVWGGRLFYRIASRSLRRGEDDERYVKVKRDNDWTQLLVNTYLPEALFQTLISLPFTAPFRHQGGVLTGYHPYIQALAVGIFSAGFTLEWLADVQQEAYKDSGETGLQTKGVWSIVRHPNYLGDALVHLSFPILLFGSDMLAVPELLGVIANYVYLRYVGGDKENEASQEEKYEANPEKKAQFVEWKEKKNSFWPDVEQLRNKWTWIVVAAGAVGVGIEQAFLTFHHN